MGPSEGLSDHWPGGISLLAFRCFWLYSKRPQAYSHTRDVYSLQQRFDQSVTAGDIAIAPSAKDDRAASEEPRSLLRGIFKGKSHLGAQPSNSQPAAVPKELLAIPAGPEIAPFPSHSKLWPIAGYRQHSGFFHVKPSTWTLANSGWLNYWTRMYTDCHGFGFKC